jgi:phospholipid transport system substrate-binding protein
MMRRAVLFAGLLVAAGFVWAPANAADPAQVISRLGSEGMAAIGPNVGPQERLARFRQLFAEDFDTATIARFVLGQYWRVASGPERAEFDRVFADYISLVYSNRLAAYEGARLVVTGTRNGPDGTLVLSKVERANAQPVEIDWRMSPYGDTWRVVDVIVDGVSMAATQRDEFSSIIERSGGDVGALLTAMRDKIGNLGAGAVASEPQPTTPPAGYGGSSPPPPGALVPPPR